MGEHITKEDRGVGHISGTLPKATQKEKYEKKGAYECPWYK